MRSDKKHEILTLNLRTWTLVRDAERRNTWHEVITPHEVPAQRVAVLICDMWDQHWSRGATMRVDAMVPRMNHVIDTARTKGMHIIHAPSDTLDFYTDTPARERAHAIPPVAPPPPKALPDPPLPIDDSDEGSDTGEPKPYKAWHRQHAGITIDQTEDYISDDGREIYSLIQTLGIEHLLIMGVHTNMCVLNRSFGIKPMVRWGVSIALVRDLTDTMYNPAMSPYVSHDEGTRLVIAYIEKFWCPSVLSQDINP